MIEPMVYPGSLQDFRGFMLNLEGSLRKQAKETDYGKQVDLEDLEFIGMINAHYNFENSSIWQYESYSLFRIMAKLEHHDKPVSSALIVAIQVKPNETAVNFYDGVGYFESGDINPTILPCNFFAEEFGMSFGNQWPRNNYYLLPAPAGLILYDFEPAGAAFQDYVDLIKQKIAPPELIARRGPKAVPKEVQRKYIREWKLREGEITLLAYCNEIGVGVSTFRGWRAQEELAAK